MNIGISIIFTTLFGLFGWEHFFRINDLPYRPTVGVDYITGILRIVFEFVGDCFAKLSSFLTLLDFTELKKTCSGIFMSGWNFGTSFLYVLKGYYEQVQTYVEEQDIVYLGSFLLFACVVGILGYYAYNKYCELYPLDPTNKNKQYLGPQDVRTCVNIK